MNKSTNEHSFNIRRIFHLRCFIKEKINAYPNIGSYTQNFGLSKIYRDYLLKTSDNSLQGLTVVLDCAYGAARKIAPNVFKKLGAKVIAINCRNNGLKINDNCGALYPENLIKKVTKYKADMGFAFDGDTDRIIAVSEKGEIIDGDMIIFGLAKYLKNKNKLKKDTVVGTTHTNMAIENALKKESIDLIRTDIGDKYVLAKLLEKDLSLGGEQSGHIILKDIATTGDGILTAIFVSNMVKKENKSLEFFSFLLFCRRKWKEKNDKTIFNDLFYHIFTIFKFSPIFKKKNEFLNWKWKKWKI